MRGALLVVALVGLAGCSFSPAPPVDPLPPVIGILQIFVQDEQERPIPGAKVTGSAIEETTTDHTGMALLRSYASATSMSVRLTNYEDVFVAQVPIPQSAPVRVVLKRRR